MFIKLAIFLLVAAPSFIGCYKQVSLYVNLATIQSRFDGVERDIERRYNTLKDGIPVPAEPQRDVFNKDYDWNKTVSTGEEQILNYLYDVITNLRKRHRIVYNRFLDYSKKDLIPLIPDEGELEDGTKRNIKIISKPSTSWDTSQSFVISNFISDAKNMFKDLGSEDYSKFGEDFITVALKLVDAAVTPATKPEAYKAELNKAFDFSFTLAQLIDLNTRLDLLDTVTDSLCNSFLKADHLTSDLVDPKEFEKVVKGQNLLTLDADFHHKKVEDMYKDQETPLVRTYHANQNVLAVHALVMEDTDMSVWTRIMDYLKKNLNGPIMEICQFVLPLIYLILIKIFVRCRNCRNCRNCQQESGQPKMKPFAEMQRLLTRKEPTAPLY